MITTRILLNRRPTTWTLLRRRRHGGITRRILTIPLGVHQAAVILLTSLKFVPGAIVDKAHSVVAEIANH